MLETYKNLLPLADNRLLEPEIISSYQDNQSPICFATIFTRHFAALRNISENYWGITDADKASFCLEELHKALLSFSPERGVKFLTFLLACVKNRLRAETQALSADKRKADYCLQETPDGSSTVRQYVFEEMRLAGKAYYPEMVSPIDLFVETELSLSVQAASLTENEKAYCQYFAQETVHATASDFARKRGISDVTVHYIRLALRKKINTVMA